jgi:uncharacterized protein YjbI with pentapeptide repeats
MLQEAMSILGGAYLREADRSGAELVETNLSGGNLSGAYLKGQLGWS